MERSDEINDDFNDVIDDRNETIRCRIVKGGIIYLKAVRMCCMRRREIAHTNGHEGRLKKTVCASDEVHGAYAGGLWRRNCKGESCERQEGEEHEFRRKHGCLMR
jgi:hypothetical protein